jgi:hypothetical protein
MIVATWLVHVENVFFKSECWAVLNFDEFVINDFIYSNPKRKRGNNL